jgi:hypothetical protein
MNKKNLLKNFTKIWVIFCLFALNLVVYPHNIHAQEDMDVDWFYILPELSGESIDKINTAIERIWKTWGNVLNEYTKTAETLKPQEQINSWIMNWDTIMNYLVFIVKFLSQLWLVVGFWFIMYAWYKYMVSVFNNGKTPSSTITNAIIWVIIVIFSYAIMKILTSVIGIN